MKFLNYNIPFFPQYTYYQTTKKNDQWNYVDEYSIISWTSYHNFNNPLAFPLYNNPADTEKCQSRLHNLTTAHHEKQFKTLELTQTTDSFVAQKANRISINHYDHAIARYMEDTATEDDPNTGPQLIENFFVESEYVFLLDNMNQIYDKIISTALKNTNAYESYFNKK